MKPRVDRSGILLPLIGLMKRAGALVQGADACCDACEGGKARLMIVSDDIAENTLRRAEEASRHKAVPILPAGCGKAELGGALGAGDCAVACVCDTGFALSLCEKLGLTELAEDMRIKLQREKRRKAKKLAGKGKADISKRGNKS